MVDAPDLLPCPFCGGEKIMCLPPTCHPSKPYDPTDRMYPIVRCQSCGGEINGTNNDGPRDDRSTTSAIAAWNTRADLSPTRAQVEALVRPLEFSGSRDGDKFDLFALTPFGTRYRVTKGAYLRDEATHIGVRTDRTVKEGLDDESDGVSAAQADYTRRILSALNLPEG